MSATGRVERVLYVRELDPARVAEYRRDHDAIWPDLVALYKRCGITEVSCLLDGSTLAVLFETDPELFRAGRAELESSPVEIAWQEQMKKYDVSGKPTRVFVEVYRQSDH